VHGDRTRLPPDGDVEDPFAIDAHYRRLVSRPTRRIGQKPAVIDAENLPENPVDVPWKVHDSALAHFMHVNLWNGRAYLTRIDFFHRQVRVRGHQRQRGNAKVLARTDIQAEGSVYDAVSGL